MGQLPAIAVLGGSGELGSALARRWAQAGYPVIMGSRSADRAIEVAALNGMSFGLINPWCEQRKI